MIGLFLPTNIKYAPYINNYIEILSKRKIDYEIILWDKRGIEKESDNIYKKKMEDKNSLKKIIKYVGFIKFIRKKIKQRNYEKVIVFTLAPAIFLIDILLNRYKNNYILDVRDDTPLRKFLYHNIILLARNAQILIASSPCYEKWLKRKVTLCHNIDVEKIKEEIEYTPKKKEGDTICITCAGMMMEGKTNLYFLQKYASDSKMKFCYYGPMNQEMEVLKEYAKDRKNVKFMGIYKKEDIYNIYRKQTDYVNVLRHKSVVNAEALPNKLYEAVISGVPIIAFEHNEAISFYSKKYYLGVIFKDENEIMNENTFYQKIFVFDYEKYSIGRKKFLADVLNCMNEFEEVLIRFAE